MEKNELQTSIHKLESLTEGHAKQLREQVEYAEQEIKASKVQTPIFSIEISKEKIEALTVEKNSIIKNIQQLVQQVNHR